MESVAQTQDSGSNNTPTRCLRLIRDEARARALRAWPLFGGEGTTPLDFSGLLTVLGYKADEFVPISHQIGDGKFSPSVVTAADVVARVSGLSVHADQWFGTNPTEGPARSGQKGKADQVTRLAALTADLDVKDNGCPDFATCWAIIDALSKMLGTRPTAVVESGHGLQPYWPISDGDRVTATANGISITVLTRRWGRLVAAVASSHNSAVDSIFNLDRILRVPGTFNCKEVEKGGKPIPVVGSHNPAADAVSLSHVGTVLDAHGVRPEVSDGETGQIYFNSDLWKYADKTCDYVRTLADGFSSDGPNPNGKTRGRHQWMFNQCVRLACAYRLGCIAKADLPRILKSLQDRLIQLRSDTGESVSPTEIRAAFVSAMDNVSRKTNKETKAELRNHTHRSGPDDTQATRLVDLAMSEYSLGISADSRVFAYRSDAPHVALYLHSRKFGLKPLLARDYFKKYGSAASDNSLKSAMSILEGEARDLPATKLWVRVAGDRNKIHIDMADDANRVIEISDGDWRIVESSPYMFRRTELIAAQNEPAFGGKLNKLWRFVNIEKQDRPLLMAVLIDALINPETAKPITGLLAEHGSAKTSTGRCIVNLVDPSTAELRSPPRELGSWITAGAGSWMIGIDNLSSIPDWLSDAMCRAATGDGDVRRELFTNDDLTVFSFLRPVIFTGIFMHFNQDLADRMVEISLRSIGDNRMEEEEFKAAWTESQPEILGGLLSLAAKVQQKLPGMKVEKLPRMADYARVLACIDTICGTQGLKRYREVLARTAVASANDDSFIARIMQLRLNTDKHSRDGMTATEIFQEVSFDYHVDKPIDWPKKAQSVSARLTRNGPALRLSGWTVANDGGANHDKIMRWTLRPPGAKPEAK